MKNTYSKRILVFIMGGLAFSHNISASTSSISIGNYEISIMLLIAFLFIVVFLIPVMFFLKKISSGLNQSSRSNNQEYELLLIKNRDLEFKLKEQERACSKLSVTNCDSNSELNKLKDEVLSLKEHNIFLNTQTDSLKNTISTLNGNKKDLELLLLNKIKEHDALERKVEEKIAEAAENVKNAESIQDNFFIETIHEMRTPLSLILGSLSLVVQNEDQHKDMSIQIISAYRNTLALQDLGDQLIGMRSANGTVSYLRIARYDLVEIVRQMCDIYVDWIAMNNIDFKINTVCASLWVWIDRRKIEFAIRMLLTNALKNTFSYGKVALDISIIKENGDSYCQLKFTDEGLTEDEGSRRGLKLIKESLSAMGGLYTHSSDINRTQYAILIHLGKTHLLEKTVEFVEPENDLVRLNAKQKEEIAELIQIIPQQKETDKTLLIIDDSDQIRWFLRHVFQKEYNILEARNGQEGIDIAISEVPDIILCDVMMPGKDGFQTCREIKQNSDLSQVPIVMLTAKVESEDVITGIEAGADDYITKPFDVEVLHSKVNSLIRKQEQMKHYFINMNPDKNNNEEIKEEPRNPFMDSVIETIEKHLDDSTFEAKILADSMNMSLPTLYRKIKQYSDLSVLELTRNLRLKKAAELLRTQRYSVQEVADMVGFNDTATFRKRFTEQYGVTPSQYNNSQN